MNKNVIATFKKDTKNQIISKARDIFWKKGYLGTSMKDIAKSIGCKPANLYNYFQSKEQLLYETLLEEMQRLISLIENLEDNGTIDPVEQLKTLVRNQTNLLLGSRRSSKLLFDMEFEKLPPSKRKIIVELRDRYDIILRKIIHRMMDSGIISAIDEKIASICIVSMIVRSRIWFSPKGKLSVDDTADFLFKFALFGLLGEGKNDEARKIRKKLFLSQRP
jgi:AcrR family transcriptional regulator